MRRREFITLLGGAAAAAWPGATRAQQDVKVARIGWMSRGSATANDPNMNAFRQGMRELGYVEGQSFVMETRYAAGKAELMLDQAAELERIGVDVIIAGPFEALQAAKQAPAVFPSS
jgi:putative tryptophan/tyrosine transport system substrate-binding protein